MNKYVQSDFAQSTKFVQVNDLHRMMLNGIVDFTIPGDTGNFSATTVKYDYNDDFDYGWAANLQNEIGHIILVAKDTSYVGIIQTRNAYYSLEYVKPGYGVLVRHDMEEYEQDICATATPAPPISSPECVDNYNTCPAMINILVLVTPEAQAELIEIAGNNTFIAQLYFWLSVYTLDLTFFNSDIPNKNVRFTVVPFEMPLGNVLGADLFELSNNQQANDLRDQYEADMVIMLTDSRYFHYGGANCIGNKNSGCCFGIVATSFLNAPTYTFVHEIGHLLSGRHQREHDDTDVCSHAYYVPSEGLSGPDPDEDFFTAIATQVVHHVLHFSNPEVEIEGFPTGTEDDDNARTFRNTACEWADVYESGEMLIGIDGSNGACDEAMKTYTANVIPANAGTPGQPPYTYEWRWNTTGVFSQNDPGTFTSNASQITIGNFNCPFFFLYLQVNSSDNVIATRIRKIRTISCDNCQGIPNPGDDQSGLLVPNVSSGISISQFVISPNPAFEKVHLSFISGSEGRATIKIQDVHGKTIIYNDFKVENGFQNIEIGLNAIVPGIYICSLEIDGDFITKKLIVD